VSWSVAGPGLLSEGFAIRGCEFRKKSYAQKKTYSLASLKFSRGRRGQIQDGFHDIPIGEPGRRRDLCCSVRHGELSIDGCKEVANRGQPCCRKKGELWLWVLKKGP
jgi:hypothetical protein